MKFDLMYYLRMSNEEIMQMSLAELFWYYERLKETKDKELEFEKIKLETMLVSSGIKGAKGIFS